MKLGSLLIGVMAGYAVHKYVGKQLDMGVDPAIAAIKEKVEKKFKREPAVTPATGITPDEGVIQMS